MALSDAFRRALEELDIAAARRLWLPFGSASDFEVLGALHHARTQAASVAFGLRAWSHRWLLDHDLPSGLPDRLKPRAERVYPKLVGGIGIAFMLSGAHMRERASHARERMEIAALDAWNDGRCDPAVVQRRLIEVRDQALRA